ncbi:uncharacterized protein E6C27_scaffold675G001490 [Cucumis melo var. makuwa]|uniref:Uncharacterized protein n=1 Tax=Cucumis melo var. makuwa TaxID=1194695 RepID=A0A5A7U9F3_CUCMM|nr:uncharacterized protein E6C27_scaffold675G001490 [Cucumis melo var. makuwa]
MSDSLWKVSAHGRRARREDPRRLWKFLKLSMTDVKHRDERNVRAPDGRDGDLRARSRPLQTRPDASGTFYVGHEQCYSNDPCGGIDTKLKSVSKPRFKRKYVCVLASIMSAEEGHTSPVEQVIEGPVTRGRKEQHSPTRRSKSKGPAVREHVDTRLTNLEQENAEITSVAKEMIEDMGRTFQKELRELASTVTTLKAFVEGELHDIHTKSISFEMRLDAFCVECRSKHLGNNAPSTSTHPTTSGTSNIKVPKPDVYNGVRNATVMDNFLFGLERYFVALGVRDDEARINHAPTFLRDAAQL